MRTAKLRNALLHSALDLRHVAHIDNDGECAAACALNLLGGGVDGALEPSAR